MTSQLGPEVDDLQQFESLFKPFPLSIAEIDLLELIYVGNSYVFKGGSAFE